MAAFDLVRWSTDDEATYKARHACGVGRDQVVPRGIRLLSEIRKKG
jgi:hypothetical protein